MTDDTKGILFLCVANSARSQMAEGLGEGLGGVIFGVFAKEEMLSA